MGEPGLDALVSLLNLPHYEIKRQLKNLKRGDTSFSDAVFDLITGGGAAIFMGGLGRTQCLEGAEEVLAPPRRGSRCSGRVESVRP